MDLDGFCIVPRFLTHEHSMDWASWGARDINQDQRARGHNHTGATKWTLHGGLAGACLFETTSQFYYSNTWKILEWIATGKMMEDPMVRREPMSDMTKARNGTQQAVPKQAKAILVRTKILLTPSDRPVNKMSKACSQGSMQRMP